MYFFYDFVGCHLKAVCIFLLLSSTGDKHTIFVAVALGKSAGLFEKYCGV